MTARQRPYNRLSLVEGTENTPIFVTPMYPLRHVALDLVGTFRLYGSNKDLQISEFRSVLRLLAISDPRPKVRQLAGIASEGLDSMPVQKEHLRKSLGVMHFRDYPVSEVTAREIVVFIDTADSTVLALRVLAEGQKIAIPNAVVGALMTWEAGIRLFATLGWQAGCRRQSTELIGQQVGYWPNHPYTPTARQ